MLHELKYLGAKEVGVYLGKSLAETLQNSERFAGVEYVVPVPLHPRRQKSRGYNQSEVIAQGMEEKGFHVLPQALKRLHNNASQTRKTMAERYVNVQQVFALNKSDMLRGKKVLLLDDVLTTGATLEACAKELLKIDGIELYVATIACAEY
jgi:ComF family protein